MFRCYQFDLPDSLTLDVRSFLWITLGWIPKHRIYILIHTAACPTHRLLWFCGFCIPAGLRSGQTTCLQYRQSGNVRAGPSSDAARWWSVLLCIEYSEQHSLAGTQQCAQMLTSVYLTSNFGSCWEYWEYILQSCKYSQYGVYYLCYNGQAIRNRP